MIFAPIIYLIMQVGVTRAVGFRFPRLTWSLSVLLAFLSVIGIVFLVPFLPMQLTVLPWKPVELFNVSLDYELKQTHWTILIAIFTLYFSAIVYHPEQSHRNRIFRIDCFALTVITAILAVISADIFSALIAIVLFDIIYIGYSRIGRSSDISASNNVKKEIFSRSGSILLLLGAAVLSSDTLLSIGQLNRNESISAWLLLTAVLLRLISQKFPIDNSEKSYEYRTFSGFLNSAMSFSLLLSSGFMLEAIPGRGLIAILGFVILFSRIPELLSQRYDGTYHKAFSIYVTGLTLMIMALAPLQSRDCLSMGVIILLSGASVLFLQPFYENRHKISVVVFSVLLLGLPFTPSGGWAVSWSNFSVDGLPIVYRVLIPVLLAILAFSVYQYREVAIQPWPDKETITRALHMAGPVLPLVTAVAVSIWNRPEFPGLSSGIMMFFVVGISYALLRVQNRLLGSITQLRSRIPDLQLAGSVGKIRIIERLIQQSMEEVEDFLEGENSFLWIMLVLVVVALMNWR